MWAAVAWASCTPPRTAPRAWRWPSSWEAASRLSSGSSEWVLGGWKVVLQAPKAAAAVHASELQLACPCTEP